ncbi:hypothetical protein MTR67_051293, partial [Solanum verrucosum]
YDETNIGITKSLVGTLGGDESYYLSDEAPSFGIDDKTCWGDGEEADQVVHKPVRRKKTPNKDVFDKTSEKDIIRKELDIHVGRPIVRRARTRVLQEIMGDHIVEYESFTAWILPARSCSCRSWKLRGIPCPHGVAALHFKELEPINFVASCYCKETYLSTYAHFIQPMNNMKMWPTSNNPIIKPPKIKKMPGRPSKARGTGPSQSAEPSS